MASLFDRAVETSFKPSEDGGYVFHRPNAWLFGPMRTYRVNEAQKQSLAACLRQRQRLALGLMAIYLAIAFGVSMLFETSVAAPDPSSTGFVALVVIALMGMLALALVPHLYLVRKLKPLLADLQRADEPMTLHEQLFGVASVISPLHLGLGGLGGFLVALSNIKTIAEVLYGGTDGSLLWSGFGLLCGTVLMAYFGYLTLLRRKLKRNPK